MTWNSLLLARDAETLALLQPVLAELDVTVEAASAAQAALMQLGLGRYDLVVCDCDATEESYLLPSVRQASGNNRLVVIAIVNETAAMQAAFNQGANFVLCKPLARDMARRTARAAVCVLHRLARRFPRRTVHSLALVSIDGTPDKAILMQLSEGGMGVQALGPMEVSRSLALRFQLPGTSFSVEATGEIAWADPSGRIGIRFAELSDAARERVRDWVFSDALDGAAGVPELDEEVPTGGRLRVVPAPQKLCAALLDGVIVVAATGIFELVALGLVSNWPHRLMMQASAFAIPALFWTIYQFLFLRSHTPGMHMARRVSIWLAMPRSAWAGLLTAPLRALWIWTSRLSARIDMELAPRTLEPQSSITIQPAMRT